MRMTFIYSFIYLFILNCDQNSYFSTFRQYVKWNLGLSLTSFLLIQAYTTALRLVPTNEFDTDYELTTTTTLRPSGSTQNKHPG